MGSVCHVGMDAHKDTLTIATARGQEEARFFGAIPNTQAALDSFVRKPVSRGEPLCLVHEAGPAGYGIYRRLTADGHACMVAAPALIPRKPGDRVKTDRRDAVKLAHL